MQPCPRSFREALGLAVAVTVAGWLGLPPAANAVILDECGDGYCTGSELGTDTCPQDCQNYCGDGICSGPEAPYSCPADCSTGPYCGDGSCDSGETKTNCRADCCLNPVNIICYPGSGDVNKDGCRDEDDVTFLANFLAGNIPLSSTCASANTVFDCGPPTIQDLAVLANFLAHNVTALPLCGLPPSLAPLCPPPL